MKLQSKLRKEFFDLRLGRTPDVFKMGRLLTAIKARTNTNLPNRRYYYKDIGVAFEQGYASS